MPPKRFKEISPAIRTRSSQKEEIKPTEGSPPLRTPNTPRLAETFPEIAAEWHPTLNGAFAPYNVSQFAAHRAWWKCKFGHVWRRAVSNRTFAKDTGCPECELEASSIAGQRPDLAKLWSSKNGDLNPNKVRPNAPFLVWWQCEIKDHDDYLRTVVLRCDTTKPRGCPVCAGYQPEKSQSLAALFPNLLKDWHPTLNGDVNPYQLVPGSNFVAWWRCAKDKEHEWPAAVFHRTTDCPECPYCSLFYITDKNRLSVLFPDVAAEFHPQKNRFLWPHIEGNFKFKRNLRIPPQLKARNRRLRASDLAYNSKETVWWKCKSKGHEWEMSVENRTIRNRNCPECKAEKLAQEDSLAAQFPSLAKLWHPTRNAPLKPTDFVPGSAQEIIWRCPKSATHNWPAPIYSMVRSFKGGTHGCPWCSGLKTDEKNSLKSKCPAVAKLWHPTENGELTPDDFTFKSNERAWFHCGKPKHVFESEIARMVTSFERGHNGCPFCRGKRAAPDNCLKRKYPQVAKMWHPTKNEKLTPSDVTPGSFTIAFWLCEYGHDWPAKVSAMVQSHRLKSAAKGCPYCYGKKPTKGHNLFDEYPEAAKLWDPEKNLPTKPWGILPKSNKVFHWRCGQHSWKAKVSNVVMRVIERKTACPECRKS